jgi:hypothetical protein
MRGRPYYNFPAFDAAEDRLRREGESVINPASLDRQRGFDGTTLPATTDWRQIPAGFDLHQCVRADVDKLLGCDGIYLLAGWESSLGARAEAAVAKWLGLPMRFEVAPTTIDTGTVRQFATGATRDTAMDKPDFDGFLSESVLRAFGAYMHKHRKQSDGSLRDSDNWQKGIPRPVYRKSAWRHFLDWWGRHRRNEDIEEAACALLFNVMGDLHEYLKEKTK